MLEQIDWSSRIERACASRSVLDQQRRREACGFVDIGLTVSSDYNKIDDDESSSVVRATVQKTAQANCCDHKVIRICLVMLCPCVVRFRGL